MKRLGDDENLLRMFAQKLPPSISDRIEGLKTALNENDIDEIIAHAHALKGMTANASARRLSNTAYKMETAAKEGESEIFQSLINELEQEFERFSAVLRPYM